MDFIIYIVIAACLIGILLYNSLINRKQKVAYAFGGIDALLKKRADLIPNLVNTVKGYTDHEKSILEKVTSLRREVVKDTIKDNQRFQNENLIASLLGQIAITVENYPQLKASENYLKLQQALNEIEEQISAARRAYNATVYDYNNGMEMFPFSLMAKFMHYEKKTFFEIPASEKSVTPVKTNENS